MVKRRPAARENNAISDFFLIEYMLFSEILKCKFCLNCYINSRRVGEIPEEIEVIAIYRIGQIAHYQPRIQHLGATHFEGITRHKIHQEIGIGRRLQQAFHLALQLLLFFIIPFDLAIDIAPSESTENIQFVESSIQSGITDG